MFSIMHIVLGLQIGGLENFVLNMIANNSKDFNPLIVCLEGKGHLGENFDLVPVYELAKQPGISWRTVIQLVHMIRQNNIQIIHTHNPSPHFYGALAGMLTRCPVINTKHGRNYPTEKKKVWLNRFATLLSNKVVAVSQDAADVCIEIEKIPPSKVHVILNGVDTRLFCPSESAKTDGLQPIQVGIVARLSAEKDHKNLLQASQYLAEKGACFHLNIIGDGPLRNELEEDVNSLGISSHVTIMGMRRDIPELLKKMDIFVLSSTTEGISLTLLEAMATGLPVVATRVGGNPEVVVDGSTGFLVPPKDPVCMAEKLFQLVRNRTLRDEMGIQGRRRVLEKFSLTETVRAYEELYYTVLKG